MNTNLVGKFGRAKIWSEVETPVEIVSVHASGDNLRVCVKATETRANYHVCGQLYVIGAERIRLN